MRVSAVRGEALVRRSGGAASETLVATTTVPLALNKGDIVEVTSGEVELSLNSDMLLTLSKGSAGAVLGIASFELQRGELAITVRPGKEPRPLYVQGPPGSFPLKVRDARIRVEGEALVISVYDGIARPGSPNILWGPAVGSGQVTRWSKGQPPMPARSALEAPQWITAGELFLQGSALSAISLRWQPTPGAARYRVELLRSEGDSDAKPLPISTQEVVGSQTNLDLKGLGVGSYLTRVSAIDDAGASGLPSMARQLLVAQLPSLETDGVIRLPAGSQPQVLVPPGQSATLLLDGDAVPAAGVSGGTHRLRVTLAGLAAEAPLVAQAHPAVSEQAPLGIGEHTAPTNEPAESAHVATKPAVAASTTKPAVPPAAVPSQVQVVPPVVPPVAPDPEPVLVTQTPEDVLLGGIGEVPLDGVRSPWAGRQVMLRLESTLTGAVRIAASGRLTMRNGFGVDLSVSLLRAALAELPPDSTGTSFGNLTAMLRSPALRKRGFALQAVVGGVVPLSGSALDTAIEVDSLKEPSGNSLRVDARPRGGGWRVEPAVLLGLHLKQFWLVTNQGVSLSLSPELRASYIGNLAVHADIVPMVRFVSFAQWHVGYLGIAIEDGDALPDVGGAVGAGFEALLPTHRLGTLRLGLLGRVGIGNAGAAAYGRGTLGLQAGFLFN